MKSEQHRRNVASLPCAECGIESYSQCAHANGYEYGKCRGMKSSDLATFPLCCTRIGVVGCHEKHDQLKDMTKDEAREREHRYIFTTLSQLFEAGKLKAVK